MFTVYPSAQAHFIYACPIGNCDGTYDLNEAVFGLLRADVPGHGCTPLHGAQDARRRRSALRAGRDLCGGGAL